MLTEHFVVSPHWEWYILAYFVAAGLSGGAYVIGTMLRLWGDARDLPTSRLAFFIGWPLLLVCPILLTLDLGQPTRFWHMLIDSRTAGLVFKAWSPMSVGAWALLIYGIFSTAMFVVALGETRSTPALLPRVARVAGTLLGRVLMVVGALFALFVSAYTGVLLAVSNQPVWSDSWTLGGLFLASGLSGASALVLLLTRRRLEAAATDQKLLEADRYFIILELVLIALFFVTLGGVLSRVLSGGWLVLWLVVLLGTVVPLLVHWRPAWRQRISPDLGPILVLLGVLALRAVVIFSPQS
jgi:formate-dependent nitrite reductase membrane component NrfD